MTLAPPNKSLIIPAAVAGVSTLLRAFNLQNVRVQVEKDNKYEGKIPKGLPADPEFYKSRLGTPVVADITFMPGFYTDDNGRSVNFQGITLDTMLITVAQQKRIVITEIQGRDGSVKEYIGMGDYQVTINGMIIGDNGRYPSQEVAALKEICKAPVSLQVVSRYLQNLDIFNLVVQDFTFDQAPGGYSQQLFSILCLSDAPVELIINPPEFV